jgi:hypothetical protein
MRLAQGAILAVVATAATPFLTGAVLAQEQDGGGDSVDIEIYRHKMRVLGDGKGHYLALMPFTISDGPDTGWLFYGDGKTMYAQRRFGGGRVGNSSFENIFWDPRATAPYQAQLALRDGTYTVTCDDRKTELVRLAPAEAQPILEGAAWKKPRWNRRAYALARDNAGTYYFVDRAREPPGSKDFRVFRGPKGAVKPQKMVNVVSDSEGDIFITKAGKLRLVLDKHESTWVEGKKAVKLTPLDVGDNHQLVYSELGVYAGEPLGTPCDDL